MAKTPKAFNQGIKKYTMIMCFINNTLHDHLLFASMYKNPIPNDYVLPVVTLHAKKASFQHDTSVPNNIVKHTGLYTHHNLIYCPVHYCPTPMIRL